MKNARLTRVILLMLTVVVLAGVFYVTPKLEPATAKSFTLVLKDNALVSGPTLMTVNEGDTVTLRIQSDREGHFMLHGYPNDLVVGPDGDASTTFVADHSGLYMLHLHQADQHIEIARMDVKPR